MGKITAIRDLDEDTFRKLRAAAIEENMKVGDAVNIAMKKWLAQVFWWHLKSIPTATMKTRLL